MNYSRNLSKTGQWITRLLCAVVVCFLIQSCKSDGKETLPEANIEKESNLVTKESTSREEILSQEKAWAASLVVNDMNTVSSIMHRDFRLTRAYGGAHPISKDMYLGMKEMSASSAEVTSLKIAEEMDSIVVARVTMTLDWNQEGVGKLPPHFDMIDTWKKSKEGIWQILARVSQIADGPYRKTE